MRLRRALSYAALGIGVAAATNTALRREAGELPPALDGMQRTYRWRGMNVAYTEAGDASDPDLVLLHGLNAAGSAGEWREVFEELSEEYHVIAPDLPGFGNSERPPLRYSAALYEDFVSDFVSEFDEPAVFASSLSAAYIARGADAADVSRLVLVCPTTTAGPAESKGWLRELIRLPLVGEAAFNTIASKPSIRYFNADHGYADPESVSEEWQEYEWLTAHQKNARFAPASFIAGYLNSDLDLASTLADLDIPITLVWGREADISPLSDGKELAEEAGCELVAFDRAKLLPHVERADAFLDFVVDGELPDDHSVVVEHGPDRSAEDTPAADTDAAASTGALADEADAEDGAAEPAEATIPEGDDPGAADPDEEAAEVADEDEPETKTDAADPEEADPEEADADEAETEAEAKN